MNKKKVDHRKLAKQLDLYHIEENAPGLVCWHPNGWIIFCELEKFIRKKFKIYEYQEVKTPWMMKQTLWKKTGHWDNYSEYMYTIASENDEYCIKPMNCPGHVKIFNQGVKSYRDLPIRLAEFGSCYRNEPSGALHGLMRTRGFVQDDGHIFCMQSQILDELNCCVKMMYDIYDIFGFKNIIVQLSTRPEKRIGEDVIWDISERSLANILKENNIVFKYQMNAGAFYGPKIEFTLLDSMNRFWQCGTIQLDFSLPNSLDAFYVDMYNNRVPPVMIHRAVLGSIERFIAILTEECAGFYPIWLAPVQVVLLNITEKHAQYILMLKKDMLKLDIRVKADLRNETIGFKIREHTLKRIPYILICGDKEISEKTVSVRTSRGKNLGNYDVNVFINKLIYEIKSYAYQ
ncbi:Threonine--tRNA ligase [Blochmannia endosymbiont of Polyrhachis (Hedomyrma) turneri]|nr:Threonine--tRNA ligase [Blochmannia endosymbiont of Polyrhachis (Hedomyrma) turneri]